MVGKVKLLGLVLVAALLLACEQPSGGGQFYAPDGASGDGQVHVPGGGGLLNGSELNGSELMVAGMTFEGMDGTYLFRDDRTGVKYADEGGNRSVRAVRSVSDGEFTWSAVAGSDGGIDIVITQGGVSVTGELSADGDVATLSMDGKVFFSLPDAGDGGDALVREMNLVRSDPAAYARKYIAPRLEFFDGNNYRFGKYTVVTVEGPVAVRECVEFMSGLGPYTNFLSVENGLRQAARDHALWLGGNGRTGHTGEGGSTPSDRVALYGEAAVVGECIAYGDYGMYVTDSDRARQVVIQLLVDDGTADRGHRVQILNNRFTRAGSFIGGHSSLTSVCVINFAEDYVTDDGVGGVTDSLPPTVTEEDTVPVVELLSLEGTTWIEESNPYNSSMYKALDFRSGGVVRIGACNGKALAFQYARGRDGFGQSVHSHGGTYAFSDGAGVIEPVEGDYVSGDVYGAFTVEGSLLTLTGSTPAGTEITVTYRLLPNPTESSLAGTRWSGWSGDGEYWYGVHFVDGKKVRIVRVAGETNAQSVLMGEDVLGGYVPSVTEASYSYGYGRGSVVGSTDRAVTGDFEVSVNAGRLTFGRGVVLDKM